MNVRKLARADTREDSGNTLVLTGVFLAFFFVMSVLSPKIFLSMGTMRSLFVQLPEFGIYAFAMMLAMLTGGIDLSIVSADNLASIIASNYMIWRMSQSQVPGQLQIVLTDIYTTMTQNQRVLLQTGISQAIFQLKIVEAVEFILAGQVVCRINSTQEFAINEYDEEFFSGSVAVNLYFANSAGTALKRERRELTLGLTDSLSYAMVEALIRGPEQADLLPTIPVGTKINDIFIKDGACYLDLSQEFQKNYIGGETMEQLTIFSLVNSLCGLPGINRVQILIDGRRVETYKFSVPLNSFFDRDLTLVE